MARTSHRRAGVALVANLIVAAGLWIAQEGIAASPDASSSGQVAWTFDAARPLEGAGWTTERGTLTLESGHARIVPDTNRRVVLLSPPDLPEAVRAAEQFFVGVSGTGLERVRVQARRDPRGGWITIADGRGAELQAAEGGVTVKRVPGARTAPIERLRIEMTFRTTNPRTVTGIAVKSS